MKKKFNIVGRSSWLSIAQIELFSQRVKAHFPDVELNVIIRETKGDKIQSTPLHKIEGKDFFTKDIQALLRSGEADFAIHSMKDVSGDAFFEQSNYSIFDRNDLRDVAIFNPNIEEKLRNNQKIIIGTSSPRRASMATAFLKKSLPQFVGNQIDIEAIPIRGNVNSRLEKLENEPYDGIILAAAGLNRLLQYEPSKATIERLLSDKKKMLLPLFECPPATGQGAIVAETNQDNSAANFILQIIQNQQLSNAMKAERAVAEKHGFGCSQAFGTFHLDLKKVSFTYSAGRSPTLTLPEGEGKSPTLTLPEGEGSFVEWQFDKKLSDFIKNKKHTLRWFNTAEYMKDFFNYNFIDADAGRVQNPASVGKLGAFISSHKAISNPEILKNHRVWAAGTRTWYELAKKGIWVEGCADGLGLENILSTLQSPLVGLKKEQITIFTNTESTKNWQTEGWNAQGMYELLPKHSEDIAQQLQEADAVFWTSFQQYSFYKKYLKKNVIHACPAGKTAVLLEKESIEPVVFPSIKAFKEMTNYEKP